MNIRGENITTIESVKLSSKEIKYKACLIVSQ